MQAKYSYIKLHVVASTPETRSCKKKKKERKTIKLYQTNCRILEEVEGASGSQKSDRERKTVYKNDG